jgi:hypothetical protein
MASRVRPWPLGRRLFWVVVALLVGCWQGPSLISHLQPRREVAHDFFQEWASARNYLTGLPIYLAHRESYPRHLGYPQLPEDQVEYNAHPPTSVLLAVPLGWLDYPHAFLAWDLLSLLALAVAVALVVRGLKVRWSWWALLPLGTLLLLCDPLHTHLVLGQLNLILGSLVVAAWLAWRRGHTGWAGFWLGLATALKLFPGFLLLYAVWRGQVRTVVVGSVTIAAATVLTVAVLGADCYRDYVRVVLPRLQAWQHNGGNMSLVGFWNKLFFPTYVEEQTNSLSPEELRDGVATSYRIGRSIPLYRSATVARVGGMVSVTAFILVWAWVVGRLPRSRYFDLGFALTVTVMLLFSPITWNHYYLLLLLPLAVLWKRLSGWKRGVFWVAVVSLCFNYPWLLRLTIPGGPREGVISPLHALTTLSYQTYTLLTLFVLLLLEVRRVPSGQPGRALDSSSAIRLRSTSGIGAFAPRS